MLNLNDALELALYRALRGEVPSCVHAITTDLSTRPLQLHVYHYGEDCKEQFSEEIIESEMEQCLPSDVDKSLSHILCLFHGPNEFEITSNVCLLYLNYHAITD